MFLPRQGPAAASAARESAAKTKSFARDAQAAAHHEAMSETRPSRRALPLWVRIAWAVLAGFLAATAVGGACLASRLREIGARTVEDRIEGDLALLTPLVEPRLTRNDVAGLQEIAAGARSSGVRVTVIRPDGEVIAESDHALPLENHADRPEVVAALASGRGRSVRHSATLDEELLYVALRLSDGGRVVGILRLARPLRAVTTIDDELLGALLVAGLVGVPVAAFVGWLAARRIAQPLETMTAAAMRMAAGDFSHLPLPERGDEAGRLAEALRGMGRDISAMLEASEAGRAELSAVLESMTEGVLALDPGERIVHANRSAAECLQLATTPKAGTALVEVVRLPEISAIVRSALRGKGAAESDVTLPGPAGRVLSVGAAPIRGAGGEARGAVVVLRDVTVMRRLERMRLDFVANVSHELRTPLAAMSSAIETLQSLDDDESQARANMAEVALRHAKRLGAIVDDLLVLSQIESEGDRLERARVPLLRAIRQAAAAVAPAAAAAGVTVDLPADGAEVGVLGHESRLEQVWVNLLTNAVKYNREGGSVTVEVAVDDARREACVSVRDTGHGIPAEAIPRIFERFYRVDKGRSRDQGGTGLGLAIVKHIVRAHRGRIEVQSEAGRGSTFRVHLPLAAV
jgi:two-component system phosphate regulon sensor histidine kinase PhoR